MRLRPHLTLLSLQLTLFPLPAGHGNKVVLLLVLLIPVIPVHLVEGSRCETPPSSPGTVPLVNPFPLPAGHGNKVVLLFILLVPVVPVQLLGGVAVRPAFISLLAL